MLPNCNIGSIINERQISDFSPKQKQKITLDQNCFWNWFYSSNLGWISGSNLFWIKKVWNKKPRRRKSNSPRILYGECWVGGNLVDRNGTRAVLLNYYGLNVTIKKIYRFNTFPNAAFPTNTLRNAVWCVIWQTLQIRSGSWVSHQPARSVLELQIPNCIFHLSTSFVLRKPANDFLDQIGRRNSWNWRMAYLPFNAFNTTNPNCYEYKWMWRSISFVAEIHW
jgi:hypothetical protein